jgi:hypothetical protein
MRSRRASGSLRAPSPTRAEALTDAAMSLRLRASVADMELMRRWIAQRQPRTAAAKWVVASKERMAAVLCQAAPAAAVVEAKLVGAGVPPTLSIAATKLTDQLRHDIAHWPELRELALR